METVTCPKCHQMNIATAESCSRCNFDLIDVPLSKHRAESPGLEVDIAIEEKARRGAPPENVTDTSAQEERHVRKLHRRIPTSGRFSRAGIAVTPLLNLVIIGVWWWTPRNSESNIIASIALVMGLLLVYAALNPRSATNQFRLAHSRIEARVTKKAVKNNYIDSDDPFHYLTVEFELKEWGLLSVEVSVSKTIYDAYQMGSPTYVYYCLSMPDFLLLEWEYERDNWY